LPLGGRTKACLRAGERGEKMGWTYTYKPKNESVFEFFQRRFNYTKYNGSYGKVIDCAVVNLRTAYLAYECYSPENGRVVVAIVCLLDYVPNDPYNFGYKDMEECCGPYEAECPERILRLLTPTESEWAQKWRDACWKNLANKKVRLTRGRKVRSPQPIYFTNGESYQVFTVVNAKDKLFRTEDGKIVKIKSKVKWQDFSEPTVMSNLSEQGAIF